MTINRLFTNVCTTNLTESRDFYTSLFAFDVRYDSDWFIHLVSQKSGLELGIILKSHPIVPEQARQRSSGMYLTFVVDMVNPIYDRAKVLGYEVVQAPEATEYGQMRLLLLAPEGTLCDISSPIETR
ncbi:VOC family protein [Pseudoalteromonas ardens]|uniref:VOC domain-containing protein n=1 Tax=Pseudoalteromonas rubra TaxID=43658 RepID=A0A0L0EVA8_9GAMM|nr:VOC family protein [Pseudoalteromonas sp. R96]KNC68310.1 hypothetical protein AC626_05690 [Pseudoalteromonas rubra]MDK1309663.1 VOC family protein [Pseudoalteromonas sp. R96]